VCIASLCSMPPQDEKHPADDPLTLYINGERELSEAIIVP
jgi:hypothetical protein